MQEDTRCCGTGTCLINADGLCWCGQHWDGKKMCFAPKVAPDAAAPSHESSTPDGVLAKTSKPNDPR